MQEEFNYKNQNKIASTEWLPAEIWQIILDYLSLKDLDHCRHITKEMTFFKANADEMYRRKEEKEINEQTVEASQQFLNLKNSDLFNLKVDYDFFASAMTNKK